jgi:two-component system chemotaxis response regulator CheB
LKSKVEAIVIGGSAGGMNALKIILPALERHMALSVIIVLHRRWKSADDFLYRMLNGICQLSVKEADEKERLKPGTIYLAPPNYHLMIEGNKTLALTVDEPVNYCRPSIDVLFASAAEVFGPRIIGVLLTGANNDGSQGLKVIKAYGGITVVEDPATAEVKKMPQAALDLVVPDYLLPLEKIGPLLVEIANFTL